MNNKDGGNTNTTDLEALKALQADAHELEYIESLLGRFNVFETIGFDNDEVMHSNFLGFLLDPKRNDGLKDQFIKELLREALASGDETLVPTIFEDLDSMDLGQTHMRREHHYIDILLTNEIHKLAVIIENKTWSTEHSGQLGEYYKIVTYDYPDWDVLGIYLTPHGVAPSRKKDRNRYMPLSYGAICGIVDNILEAEDLTLIPDVKMAMEHYVQMVRRRILGDPEVVRLSQQIYRKHKRAFDLIYKHRPDYRTQIRPIVEELIREHPKLEQEGSSIDTLRFGVTEWDTPSLLVSEGWTSSKRILMFIIHNNPDSLTLHLFMGPGPEATRQRILGMAATRPEVFLVPRSTSGRWLSIFNRPLLTSEAYEDLDDEEREQELRRRWAEFLQSDLPKIAEALKKETWIWESAEATST